MKKIFSKPQNQLLLELLLLPTLLIFCNGCYGGGHNPMSFTEANPPNGLSDTGPYYVSDILPLFKTNCSSCHNSVSSIPNWLDYNVAFEKRNLIFNRVVTKKDMPMGRFMSDADRDLVAAWINAGAPLQAGSKGPAGAPLPPDPIVQPDNPAPTPPGPPVDGAWSAWIETQACNATCGGGQLIQTRSCNSPPPSNGGAACVGLSEQSLSCNPEPCTTLPTPVNGAWTNWENVGTCSVSCGDGTQVQTRSCSNPSPVNGGLNCVGETRQLIPCNPGVCSADIGYNERIKPLFQIKCSSCHNATSGLPNWLDYNVAAANKSLIYNRVFVTRDMPKTGTMTEAERQLVADWVNGGAQQSQPAVPVNGGWTEFFNSGTCSATCGGGLQLQTRTCSNPATGIGGVDCVGSNSRSVACGVVACDGTVTTPPPPADGGTTPVNGGWSSWTNTGTCSVQCGGGLQNQTRACNTPVPANGGLMCSGSSTQTVACNTEACLVIIHISRAECKDQKFRVEADISPMTDVTSASMDFGAGMINVGFGSDGRVRAEGTIGTCPASVKMTTNKGGWAEALFN